MDWDKAKKTFIIILILLNCVLFGLNYSKQDKYRLSQAQEKAVFEVLSKNGIGLYTNIIDEFKPMRQISVSMPVIETDKLKKIFFDENEYTKITVEFNKTILKSDTKMLTIENNTVNFDCKNDAVKIQNFDRANAQKAADAFMMSMGPEFEKFKLDDNIIEKKGMFIFNYYENYKERKILCSNNKVTVTENGVVNLKGVYYDSEGFTGEKKEICSPDEALLTFLQKFDRQNNTRTTFINKIEIGYDFQETAEIAEGKQLKLVPCYIIYILNSDKPYVINAYTNQMKTN